MRSLGFFPSSFKGAATSGYGLPQTAGARARIKVCENGLAEEETNNEPVRFVVDAGFCPGRGAARPVLSCRVVLCVLAGWLVGFREDIQLSLRFLDGVREGTYVHGS